MIVRFVRGGICLALMSLALAACAPAGQAVRANDDGTNIGMSNGIVGLTIEKKTGHVTSMKYVAGGKEIEAAKREAIRQVYEQAADMATAVASKIIGRNLTAADQQDLVNQTLGQLEALGRK